MFYNKNSLFISETPIAVIRNIINIFDKKIYEKVHEKRV